jgi:hypothetical protein
VLVCHCQFLLTWIGSFGGICGLAAYSDFPYQVLFADRSSVGEKGFDLESVQTKNELFVLSKSLYFLALIGLFEFKIWSIGMSLSSLLLFAILCFIRFDFLTYA